MSYRIDTVLVGTALDRASDHVVRAGAALAVALGAKLRLVHAYSQPMSFAGAAWMATPPIEEFWRDEKKALARELSAQIARLGIGPELLAGTDLEVGSPHRVLVDAARRHRAGMIVVGATAGAPRAVRLLGSTADRVLRQATCPVLLVRGVLAIPPRRVLAPVDLSPLSADTFRCGLEILELMADAAEAATVEALFVLTRPARRAFAEQAGEAAADETAARELERFVGTHGGRAGSGLALKVRAGDAGDEIVAEVEASEPDLVMVGTHGRGGFERLLIGSVAADVAAAAECNVLVIPPESALKAALAREAEEREAMHALG